jgi:peroxiredoxin
LPANRNHNPYELPPDLPEPVDDGAADHLTGMALPAVRLPSTGGDPVDLAGAASSKRLVLYCYPRTGRPGEPMPAGWDEIPGARGCTPQSCAFRDHFAELKALGASVLGMSTQTIDEQREFAERAGLPYPLLSDHRLVLRDELNLPTFTAGSLELYRRITLIAEDGVIVKVFYPVFPPDRNAADVVAWLSAGSR